VRPSLVLIGLFVASAVLLANMSTPTEAAPRWPADGPIYAVDGWTVSAASVDTSRPGLATVSHTYLNSAGTRATLVVSTSPIAKAVYRAGAAVPFLGSGFTVEPLPVDGAREAFIARRGNESWLQVSTYGERRGQFGSGPVAWGLTIVDSMLGHGNDYYLARLVVPYDASSASQTVTLADTLFPRLAAYYRG
jgi:hypothetical protein